jgi:hypothetical protein
MKAEEKQYGKYDGGMLKDSSCVTTCSEQELYFYINLFGGIIWRLNHDMADGRIEANIDLSPYQYAIEYCVMHTTRFGVEIEEPKAGEHVKQTDSYWAWFRWWNNYFQRTLSQDEYEDYCHKVANGEDVSQFRPAGDWRNNVNNV